MTALLLSNELPLRVGVNVIVRAGDRRCDYCVDDFGAGDRCQFGHDTHLGFTVVAPQAWVALTGPCPTCGGTGQRWDCEDTPMAGQTSDGRWVRCSADCRDGRRIVPLYTECGLGDNEKYRVPVGRGSIEVVPVAMIVLGPRPYSVFQRDDRALVLRGAHPDEVTNRFLGYWPNDKPVPGPGRDWGIVIDCVGVAP